MGAGHAARGAPPRPCCSACCCRRAAAGAAWRAAALARVLLAWGLVFGAMALALALVAALDPGTFAQPLRDANDVPAALWRDIPAHFLASADRYARVVLDPHSGDVAALSLAGGLLTILVAKILNGLGPLQFLLLARGMWRSGVAPVAANRRAYATMLAGAVLIAAAFIAYRHFLDTRYVMLAVMLVLAPAARSLQHSWRTCSRAAASARRLLAARAAGRAWTCCWAWTGRSPT
jgi:hypothetical protein